MKLMYGGQALLQSDGRLNHQIAFVVDFFAIAHAVLLLRKCLERLTDNLVRIECPGDVDIRLALGVALVQARSEIVRYGSQRVTGKLAPLRNGSGTAEQKRSRDAMAV